MLTATAGVSEVGTIGEVSPELVDGWLRTGEAVLIDVREPFEFAEERIVGAVPRPLSTFDAGEILRAHEGRRLVFQCRSGQRSMTAAKRAAEAGGEALNLAGGILAWRAAGLPVVRPAAAPGFPIMRQVQIVAGGLVAAGVGLGAFVEPWALAVPGFVGCGLLFAGLSGWCGMARLLAAMPWNRTTTRGGGGGSCCAE